MPYLGQRPSKGDENNFKILDDISSYTLTFDGSDSSVVSAANETITSLSHRFVQGQRVTYNNGGGSNIAGLTSGTVYYIIKEDHNTIKLATSASNASNGVAVNITGVGGGSSHTLNVAFDGVNTKFKATHTNGQKAKITRSAQLVISINGVIQQPHDSATPSTGFGFDLDGTIVFSQAPVSTDIFWAHVLTNNNVTFDISDNDIDNFTGDGSTTEFNLSKSPPDNRNVLVTIDGVVQYPNDPDGTARAYVVVENVLTFNSAPPSGVEIQVRHIGFAGSSSASGGVTNFYGRTGSVVLKNTDNIVANNAEFAGNLTVQGTMTTLDTKVTEVDQLEVGANNTTVGVAITQSGSGDILRLYDGAAQLFTVADGGNVTIKNITGTPNFNIQGTNASATAESNINFLLRDGNSADRTIAKLIARNTGNGGYGALDFYTAFNNTNFRRMSIHHNGYVGIGTEVPQAKLHVYDDSAAVYTKIESTTGSATLDLRQTNKYGSLNYYYQGTHKWIIGQVNQENDICLYQPSGVSVGTPYRIIFKNDGKIGINTTNVTHQITVSALAANTIIARFKGFNQNSNFDIGTDASSHGQAYVRDNTGAVKVQLNSNGDSYFSGGNVGINSTSPGAALEVNGGTSYDVAIFNSYHADGPLIPIQRSGTNIGFLGSGKNLAPASGGADDLALRSQANLIFTSGGGVEKLRITSGGRVEVKNGTLDLGTADTSSGHLNAAEVLTFNIDTDNDDTNRYFAFYKNAKDGAGTELVRIKEDGNVGINSTIPTSKLDVDGDVKITGIVTATTFVGALTGTASGNATISSNADNRIITGGSGNSLTGESNLTWDGSTLLASGSDAQLRLYDSTASSENSAFRLMAYNGVNFIQSGKAFSSGSSADLVFSDMFGANEKLRITSSGQVHVGNATNNAINNALFKAVADDGEAADLYVGQFINLEATAGQSYGVNIRAGSNSTDHGFRVMNRANDTTQFLVRGDGNVGVNEPSPQRYLHVTGNASYGAAHFGVFGTNAGNAYIGNTPVVTISTDGNANAGTNDEKALFQVGRGGGGAGAAAVTTEHFRVNLGGTVQIGGAVGNNSHIDVQNTKLTIKQSANNKEDGIYIERVGESRGFHIYVGGALGQNDALGIASQQLGSKSDVVSIDRGGDIKISSSNFTQSVTSGAAIFKVQTTATSGDGLIQASGEDSSGNTRTIMMRTDANAGQYRIISSDTSFNLALCTGNAPRVLIAGNSAATSIGGSNVFNAMLTVQGDISGQLFHLKATENTSRLMVSGNNSNGVEMNFYDDAGGQKGIIAASSTHFSLKAPGQTSMQFMTNDGYGTVERAVIDKYGILKAHGFRRNSGTGNGLTTLRSGYQGDDYEIGPAALYYVGHKNSSSTTNYSAHEFTMYRSGHWGQYTEVMVYAYHWYYTTGYRIWHIDSGGNIREKADCGGAGIGTITSGGQQLVGSGTHGGQNVYKYEITFTNGGIYRQTKWYVGWIGNGSGGHIGNSKTVAEADTFFSTNGGGLHFPNVAHEGLLPSPKYQY